MNPEMLQHVVDPETGEAHGTPETHEQPSTSPYAEETTPRLTPEQVRQYEMASDLTFVYGTLIKLANDANNEPDDPDKSSFRAACTESLVKAAFDKKLLGEDATLEKCQETLTNLNNYLDQADSMFTTPEGEAESEEDQAAWQDSVKRRCMEMIVQGSSVEDALAHTQQLYENGAGAIINEETWDQNQSYNDTTPAITPVVEAGQVQQNLHRLDSPTATKHQAPKLVR